MIDFNKPPRQKSAEETAFDELNAEYTAKFGTPYVFDFAAAAMTWTEAVADIQRRISSGDPQRAPEYKDGALY